MPTLVNWGRTHRRRPARWLKCRSEAQVQAALADAREQGLRVKVVGARHSWSDIAMTDDVVISIDAMNQAVEVDTARNLVTVQAGMRMFALNEILAQQGLAMTVLGSVAHQSVAGVIATGTHGSSLRHGSLSSFVHAMRLITADGEVVDIGPDDPRLDAARVHLGALGVVTQVTLRVEPAFDLVETVHAIPYAEAMASLEGLLSAAEYTKLWWFPHTDEVLVFRYDRSLPGGPRPSPWSRWIDERIVNRIVFRGLLWLSSRRPELSPRINQLVMGTYFRNRVRRGRSDDMLSLAMPPVHRETEVALPLSRAAVGLGLLRDAIESEDLFVNFPAEIRTVSAESAWMSPAHGRTSVHLGAYAGHGPHADRYFDAFWARMRSLGGRPHWGKELRLRASDVPALWPRAHEFRRLARQLDPEGMFANDLVERLLR